MLKGVMFQMSRSSHDCHYITLHLSTGPHSSFRSRPKMLLDRDTNKCIDKDITEDLDKTQNKRINKYKAKLIIKHEKKRCIDK